MLATKQVNANSVDFKMQTSKKEIWYSKCVVHVRKSHMRSDFHRFVQNQTAVSNSSTQAGIISLDAGLNGRHISTEFVGTLQLTCWNRVLVVTRSPCIF